MTKYIKQRLSVKIFIITFFLLGTACSGTYFFISKLLPVTYSNLINASTEKAAMHLVEQMTAFDNISDCENDISNFSKETNTAFWIEDSNGRMIYPDEESMETSTTSADCTVTFDEDESFIDMKPSGETTTNFYPFTLKNGTAYALAVQTDLFVVQQATKVLLSILPYVILMIFLLSLLCAWLYTRYITRPIVQLSKISKQMAELDFSGQCGTGREDELGCLAQNLNSLSASLSTALNDLQTANQQLKTDIEKEQELERQRVDFFSAASHELKTPMTSIKVLADSLAGQENVPVELYQEFMQDIAAEIERESKIITDLLTLVKLDKKASNMNIELVNINELLDMILKRLHPIAAKRNIELILEGFRPVDAEIDETKLSLAISNLVENAIKYNKDEGWVRVSLNADHKYFYVTVTDSGLGIPEESIDHIFERFYRVDKSHSAEIEGTGLGLAITRSAIMMHHGAIRVKSQVGEGTTFSVRIPLTFID